MEKAAGNKISLPSRGCSPPGGQGVLLNRDVHVARLAAAAPKSAEAGAAAPRLAQWRRLLAVTLSSLAPAHCTRVGLYDRQRTAEAVICHC